MLSSCLQEMKSNPKDRIQIINKICNSIENNLKTCESNEQKSVICCDSADQFRLNAEYKLAINYYEKTLNLTVDLFLSVTVFERMAEIYERSGYKKQQVIVLERLFKINPKKGSLCVKIAQIYTELENYNKMIEYWGKIIASEAYGTQAIEWINYAYKKLNNSKKRKREEDDEETEEIENEKKKRKIDANENSPEVQSLDSQTSDKDLAGEFLFDLCFEKERLFRVQNYEGNQSILKNLLTKKEFLKDLMLDFESENELVIDQLKRKGATARKIANLLLLAFSDESINQSA
jgi:tetratricopeptide (TPR) repeat protein